MQLLFLLLVQVLVLLPLLWLLRAELSHTELNDLLHQLALRSTEAWCRTCAGCCEEDEALKRGPRSRLQETASAFTELHIRLPMTAEQQSRHSSTKRTGYDGLEAAGFVVIAPKALLMKMMIKMRRSFDGTPQIAYGRLDAGRHVLNKELNYNLLHCQFVASTAAP